MQHTKVSYELTQNYIPSPQAKEKEPVDPAMAVENRLMREIVRENLTKRQKCYIIMYYTKGMTIQEIADAEGVSKSTVSRTIGLARKRISCGMKPAMLKSALKGR
ncbi:sigma factor-like helix-turn-helix DNA-binding protein [Ruminococcus bicirculans]|uniref:Sigma factor-like helix-turn-helix DNA-binding protein n=1 Tax=Ruminococcus bicirculans (ex Wegman et al. 2014) TaxID=1160721 RepID=A0AAW6ECQ7_9FIRM|nr:sigma factor-like helix-turn-helix DNA-binding protein [Ruminococcus bicirculans (ex Wegman et al. 2014)]MDB8750310.1 sigma factor-like helix-turn-helix DNA-binding protein [Ruminococcus bicirculans (ex Wegman et al. 2014)]